jgi:uncharacterized RDD family membrane protein YckC
VRSAGHLSLPLVHGPQSSPNAEDGPISTSWTAPPRPPRPGPAPGIEYAGFWIRALAYVIDAIPFAIVVFLGVLLPFMGAVAEIVNEIPLPPRHASPYSAEYQAYQAAFTRRMNEAMGDLYPSLALMNVFPVIYFVGFWAWRGQTPGMMVLGLHIRRETDGTKPGIARSVLRYVGYWVSWIALFIGFIWVAFDGRKQGWHDKIAGTYVVKVPRAYPL